MVVGALVLVGLWLGGCQSFNTVKRRDYEGTWMGSSRISSSTYVIDGVLGFSHH
jgi:hypothetical protein